jgi:hypothetical protein
LPNALNLGDFRGLKRVVVEVREGHGIAIPTLPVNEVELEEAHEKIRRKIRVDNGLVDVSFVRSE